MSKVRSVFGRSLSVGSNSGPGENRSYSYDNPAFLRGFHGSRAVGGGSQSKSGVPDPQMIDQTLDPEDPDCGPGGSQSNPDETDLDDESFRSGRSQQAMISLQGMADKPNNRDIGKAARSQQAMISLQGSEQLRN